MVSSGLGRLRTWTAGLIAVSASSLAALPSEVKQVLHETPSIAIAAGVVRPAVESPRKVAAAEIHDTLRDTVATVTIATKATGTFARQNVAWGKQVVRGFDLA